MAKGKKTGGRDFKPGHTGNPGGRPAPSAEVRELARRYTEDAMHALIDICRDTDVTPTARVSAAQVLLDRGWGKATQHIEAKVGPLDNLSIDDQRALLSALAALSTGEGDAEEGARETTH